MTAVTETIEASGQRPCVHPLQEPNMLGLRRLLAAPLHIPTQILVNAAFVSYSVGQTPWKRLTNAFVYSTVSLETLPIHTRFEPQRGQDAERNGRATPSQARFWSVSRVGRLVLSWTSLGGFGKPQQARGW